MIVDSTSKKHHTVTTIDVGNCVLLFRSKVGHCGEVLRDIITTTHPALAEVPVGGVMGGDMPDMPQLFITKVDSTSKKHHTVITIDSDDLVVTYSLPIHQHHEEISNTHPVVPFTGVRVAARSGV